MRVKCLSLSVHVCWSSYTRMVHPHRCFHLFCLIGPQRGCGRTGTDSSGTSVSWVALVRMDRVKPLAFPPPMSAVCSEGFQKMSFKHFVFQQKHFQHCLKMCCWHFCVLQHFENSSFMIDALTDTCFNYCTHDTILSLYCICIQTYRRVYYQCENDSITSLSQTLTQHQKQEKIVLPPVLPYS